MKRTSTAGSLGSKKHPRQDPVSCESCRRKKLKCDRTLPCSSCLTRKISCSYGSHGPGQTSPVVNSASQISAPSTTDSDHTTPEPHATNHVSRPQNGDRDGSLETANWLETFMMAHRVASAAPASFRNEPAHHQRTGSPRPQTPLRENLPVPFHAHRSVSLENPASINLTSFLPSEKETMRFLQYYCNHLDWQYPLVIPDLTKKDIQALYAKASVGEPVNKSSLAILFSIVATALFFQLLSAETAEVTAEMCSRETAFLAGAALIQSDYVAYPTVEGLQASMIIMHHLSSLTLSPSISSLFLPSTSISQAKSLGLHVVDRPLLTDGRKPEPSSKTSMELKRRLWWDLATYDWLLGFLGGPQEDTYTIHPRHMNVRRPLHAEDADLETSVSDVPLSTPTCMSYTVHRLRLAEVCREMIDGTAPFHLQGQEIPYENILDLDRKLLNAYAELPAFFRFDQSSQRQYASLYHERPIVAWQRGFLQTAYHSRMCRLHRQFFIRGAKDPKYSYSHIVCLQSARKVLEVKRIMDTEQPVFMPNTSFFWAVMHHVFMAAVILLIDVCFNWDDILAEKRREEVLDACRMLSRAQQSSSIAREGIGAMMEILRKHWKQERRPLSRGLHAEQSLHPGVNLPAVELQHTAPVTVKTAQTTPELPQFRAISPPVQRSDATSTMMPLEDLWTEMLDSSANVTLDTPEWMDMLTELTNTTAPCE